MMEDGREVPHSQRERGAWSARVQFFLATLGYCVGLGALTRFPYICMKNGGGAFLLPYIICMIVGGAPFFYVGLILGQFSGLSPLALWEICPAFKGLGYSMTALSGIAAIYYMPYTWSMFFLVSSIGSDVPWRTCGNWSSYRCRDYDLNNVRNDGQNLTMSMNYSVPYAVESFTSPAEEYWNHYILGINDTGLQNIGSLRWQLVVAHFVCWVLVFLCTMKGAITAGKVVYVTATLPYLLLFILFVRGVTLDGAYEGLMYYITPNFTRLADYNVWIEAAIQVFYSLGPAWGGLITMASYNKFHHKCYREAVLVPICNLATAIFGGCVIFSVLGFMAKRNGVSVSQVAQSGPGLAFVAYPEAIAQLPLAPLWAVIFFLMIITVAIDSQFGMFETMVSGVLDLFPKLRRYKIVVCATFATGCFLSGLPLLTEGGMYVYQLLDWYAAALTFTMVGFLECIIVAYFYGLRRFYSDAKLMFGSSPNKVVAGAWMVVTPLMMAIMAFVGVWSLEPPTYGFTSYVYPRWGVYLGWAIAMISFLPTPICFILVILWTPGSVKERFRIALSPTPRWLPQDERLVDAYSKRWYSKISKKNSSSHLDQDDNGTCSTVPFAINGNHNSVNGHKLSGHSKAACDDGEFATRLYIARLSDGVDANKLSCNIEKMSNSRCDSSSDEDNGCVARDSSSAGLHYVQESISTKDGTAEGGHLFRITKL